MNALRLLALSACSFALGCGSTPESSHAEPDDWESRVAGAGLNSVLRVMSNSGAAGSGFFIHPAGLAVTNAHVVSGADGGTVQVAVADAPGGLVRFEVLARGKSRDLALLRVHVPHPVSALPLGLSAPLALGSRLLAVGGPQGMFPVVTTGVLSGRSRPGSIGPTSVPEQLIHSAATLRGSSGCPILTDAGLVVGIQAAKPSMELVKLSEPSGEEGEGFDRELQRWSIQTEGFGLAIPIEDLRSFMPSWVAPEWSTGLETGFECDAFREGCRVSDVRSGSPAEAAGLLVGDLIVSCNGMTVLSVVDLCVWLNSERRLDLAVLRGGVSLSLGFDRDPWKRPERAELSPGLFWREQGGVRTRLEAGGLERVSRSGVVGGVRLAPDHARRDAFSLELSAWIDVPTSGRWAFELTSDDGSQLYIRDMLVVDCDGLHGAKSVRGEIDLDAGLQPIRVLFFEAGGEESLEARWGLVGEELQVIADQALSHARGAGW